MCSGKVLFSGEYHTSCDRRQWRIIEKRNGLGVEEEDRKDAMGKVVFGPVKVFEVNGAPFAIFSRLVSMVKGGVVVENPAVRPAVIVTGEIPAAGEKNKLAWRLVATADKGIVAEEEERRDGLGEIVYRTVAAFTTQCSASQAIFLHLLKLLDIK